MKTLVLPHPESAFQLTDLPVPELAEGEVLIQTKAISINPVDVKTRAGKGMYGRLSTENPLILGWDVSGTVVRSNSPEFAVGDEVFGMVRFPGHGKAYAEYVAAPAAHLARKPATVTHEEAAAATLAALTAWQALVTHAGVQRGQEVLVHAAAGGVGHYAVQLARHLGAVVTGTSSAVNRDFVLSLGAERHIDYHREAFDDREYDFILDTLGGDNALRSIRATRPGGTVITIPSNAVADTETLARERGVNAYFFLVSSNGEDMKAIASLLASGALRSHVSAVFPFDEMEAAHAQVASGRTRGKVVVAV
ncbi:NADP-dependent oxidoreductase [Siphonobacter aquaeclarae]|uniref:NADPH:quinone reductase n=1 Tax=Siphonobacter aquaeclarae TaxID=563176 RepID=A0A1G9KJS8_9BACT|nr:NADP-dependent oxidoreductase [Siphonobacter aquaeclarae]SDL49856.1 NADPH:quinone reductase [Siphonobacter aquaeclarae]